MTHNAETNKLTPAEGMMLFNGSTYSDLVFLGSLDSVDNWQEVPMAQYEAYLAEQEEARKAQEAELGRGFIRPEVEE